MTLNNDGKTKRVSARDTMLRPAFRAGFRSKRDGAPWPREYDRWTQAEQFSFERGRQFAIVLPRTVRPYVGKGASKTAVAWLNAAANTSAII